MDQVPQALLIMPAGLQTGLLIITGLLAAGVAAFAGWLSLKQRSAVPLLLVFGGLASILMEPVVTSLGHAVHPRQGQIVMFDTVGRAIPWHVGLGYMAAFGVFSLIIHQRMLARTLSLSGIWKMTLLTAALYFVGEAFPVSLGLWGYFEPQALWVWKGTAPLTWNILNATCMLTSTTLMLAALPQLRGLLQVLLIPLGASGAYMGHLGGGFLLYNAVNSHLDPWAVQLAGIATVGMCLLLIWLCSQALLAIAAREAPASVVRKS